MIIKETLAESTKKLKAPCKACPFSRKCEPGATGGSDPTVFIGQAFGPFWLPCHKTCDFSDPDWKKDLSVQQCAGAAIFRTNINRWHGMPSQLLRLPENKDLVFSSPEELLAHHKGITLEEAVKELKVRSPHALMIEEFIKAQNL